MSVNESFTVYQTQGIPIVLSTIPSQPSDIFTLPEISVDRNGRIRSITQGNAAGVTGDGITIHVTPGSEISAITTGGIIPGSASLATGDQIDTAINTALAGALTFTGEFDANTGTIVGGGNLTSGAGRVAIDVGDFYVVTTAGNFYGGSIKLTSGDQVICQTAAAVGASTSVDWVPVQSNIHFATTTVPGLVSIPAGSGLDLDISSGELIMPTIGAVGTWKNRPSIAVDNKGRVTAGSDQVAFSMANTVNGIGAVGAVAISSGPRLIWWHKPFVVGGIIWSGDDTFRVSTRGYYRVTVYVTVTANDALNPSIVELNLLNNGVAVGTTQQTAAKIGIISNICMTRIFEIRVGDVVGCQISSVGPSTIRLDPRVESSITIEWIYSP